MSSTDSMGVAIVGCGMISEFQSEAIGNLPNARVVAYFDTIPEMARKRAEQFGAKAYEDYAALLADPSVDAVSICTPSGSHLEPAVQAAESGKHVMVEKPVEVSTERVDAIVQACEKNGVTLGAIFPRRFQEASRVLKQTIEAGRFGKIALADVYIKWFRTQEYYDRGGWRGTWKLDGGGALMNQGIHGIDLLQWLMGGIAEVSAMTDTMAHERIEVEDVAVANVRFKNGALGVIEGSTACWPGSKIRIEISGTEGSVVMEDEIIVDWQFEKATPEDDDIRSRFGPREGAIGGGAADPSSIDSEGHRRQFEDYFGAIQAGKRPFCDGVDGRSSVAVITAIYRAAKERRIIAVD